MRRVFLIFLILGFIEAKEIYATFSVVAKKRANLAFNISGIVDKVNVDIGSKVKKGDIIANLKANDLKANIKLAKVSLKYAKKDYLRAKNAGDALDRAKQDAFNYKFELAKAKLEQANAVYQKTILKAPFDGVITAKYIESGDGISAMPPKTVFKIESFSNKKLILEFDQKYFKSVKVGDKFRYSIDGDSKSYIGKISKIYPTIDVITRRAKAEVEVFDVPSGLFGTGYIISE
jgi:RND family efflux transporter MFP subunit